MCVGPGRETGHGVTEIRRRFVKEEAVELDLKREGLHWNKQVGGRLTLNRTAWTRSGKQSTVFLLD